nr:hypothetical protein [uncultured Noviherbaspirillum sp.]
MANLSSSSKPPLRNEAPDLLDANAGLDPDVGGNVPVGGRPVIKTKEQKKSSLFDILGITKIVKLNQEHARILTNLKRYQEIEKQLDSLNARMDRIIELLTVATGGGQKNLIMAAADDVESAVVRFDAMLKQFPATILLSVEQKEILKKSQKNLSDKYKTFSEINEITKNISKDVSDRINKLNKDIALVEMLNAKFWKEHIRLEREGVASIQRQNA